MEVIIYLNDQTTEPASLDAEAGIANLKVGDLVKIEQNDIATIETTVTYFSERYSFAQTTLELIRQSFYLKRFDDARLAIQNFKKIITEAQQTVRKLATTEPELKDNPRRAQQAMQLIQQEAQAFDKLNLFFAGYEKKERAYRQKRITVVYEGLSEVLKDINESLNAQYQKIKMTSENFEAAEKNHNSAIIDTRDSEF